MSKEMKEQKLFIPGEQGPLEAFFYQHQEAKDFLTSPNTLTQQVQKPVRPLMGVVCHPHPLYQGSMENKVVTTITKAWQQLGLSTLRFNFRGVGLSAGEYAEGKGEQHDLRSILNWVFAHYPNTGLFLGGFSFGAFIATKIAEGEEYPIQALLSVAPPLRFFSFTEETLPSAPWVIIQGEQDELVSYQEVVAWYETMKLRKPDVHLISFKDTTHFFHGRLMDLKAEIMTQMQPYL